MCLLKAGIQFDIDGKVRDMHKHTKYCDDFAVTSNNLQSLKFAMEETDKLIEESGMEKHNWLFEIKLDGKGLSSKPSLDEIYAIRNHKILGSNINIEDDYYFYDPVINLSKKLRGRHLDENLKDLSKAEQYLSIYGLTRRLYMRVVASAFCTTGGLSPIQLMMRLCFRNMLLRELESVGWDSQLSAPTKLEFLELVKFLFRMKGFRWRRSLLVDDPENMIVNENYPAVAAVFDGSGDAAGKSLYCI